MATKTNMERAKREELWCWIGCAIVIPFLAFAVFSVATGKENYFGVLLGVGAMAGFAFRGFRARKRGIADLKSGDSDTASVTASTDPPAEGSPIPEGD